MDARANVTHYERPDVVEDYAAFRGVGLLPREARALERYFPSTGRLLDLGCGAGRTTAALAARGFDVVGLDVARPMVREVHDAVPAASAVAGDAALLPFADDVFDGALFSYKGLDELRPSTARAAALREIGRVLRPGAPLAFSAHNVLRHLVPYPPTQAAFADRRQFWLANVREGRLGTPEKRDVLSTEDEEPVHFGDPLSEYRRLRACGFDVRAFLPRDGPLSAFFGPTYFVVAVARGARSPHPTPAAVT